MQAILNGTVLAEAPEEDLIHIEANWYFPPASVRSELLTRSATPYHCPWKGDCQFFDVSDASGAVLHDRAWSYPAPIPSSIDIVGKDYTDYVAFWKEVDVH